MIFTQKNTRQLIIIIGIVFLLPQVHAQLLNQFNNSDFNGYIQIRATSNFDHYNNFVLRRLKFWLKSKPEFSNHWSYKIQTTFSSFSQEKFHLQDVKINYKTGLFSFDIGQFVPQYSLQRFQSDYKIAPIERTNAVNILIPNGELGVRDIGLQSNYTSKNKKFSTHLGIFNGFGTKSYNHNNQGFMVTNKSEFLIPVNTNRQIKLGYSLAYRKADKLKFPKILTDSIKFSDTDFRYNLFVQYQNSSMNFQSEFLNARLNKQNAYGYYFLYSYQYKKNQFVFSYEKYKDLIDKTTDYPYYRIGYNYLLKSHKIKLSLDNYFQIITKQIRHYYANIQIQLFIN